MDVSRDLLTTPILSVYKLMLNINNTQVAYLLYTGFVPEPEADPPEPWDSQPEPEPEPELQLQLHASEPDEKTHAKATSITSNFVCEKDSDIFSLLLTCFYFEQFVIL